MTAPTFCSYNGTNGLITINEDCIVKISIGNTSPLYIIQSGAGGGASSYSFNMTFYGYGSSGIASPNWFKLKHSSGASN